MMNLVTAALLAAMASNPAPPQLDNETVFEITAVSLEEAAYNAVIETQELFSDEALEALLISPPAIDYPMWPLPDPNDPDLANRICGPGPPEVPVGWPSAAWCADVSAYIACLDLFDAQVAKHQAELDFWANEIQRLINLLGNPPAAGWLPGEREALQAEHDAAVAKHDEIMNDPEEGPNTIVVNCIDSTVCSVCADWALSPPALEVVMAGLTIEEG